MKDSESRNPPSGQRAYNTWSRTFANTFGASSTSTPSNDNNKSRPNKQTQFVKQTPHVRNS